MMYYVKGTTRDNLAIAGVGSLYTPKVIEGDNTDAPKAATGEEPALASSSPEARSRHDSVRQ
jgi:hypothetical protein